MTFVRDVTFSVHEGEVLGLGGMVGSGRTDIARALFGVDRPTAGVIRLNGRAVRFTSPEQAIAQGVALVPENRKADGLFMNFRGPENITVANLRALLYGPFLDLRREARTSREYFAKLSISPLQSASISRRPVAIVVRAIIDQRATAQASNQPSHVRQSAEHDRTPHPQARKRSTQSGYDPVPVDRSNDAVSGSGKHGQVDDPHLLGDLPQALLPGRQLFQATTKGESIGPYAAGADAVDPQDTEIFAQPANQMLTT